ncbi:MAG: ABC transporter permease subunit, partial [Planctomycetota bacterium]
MNGSNVKLILTREIRDQLRDRRTLFMIFVLPILLYPLLGMSLFQLTQFIDEKPSSVLIVGARSLADLPPLVENQQFAARLFNHSDGRQSGAVNRVGLLDLHFAPDEPQGPDRKLPDQPAEARLAIQMGLYDAAVYFPPDFADRLQAFREALRAKMDAVEMPAGENGESGQPVAEETPPVPRPEIIYSTANEKSQIAFARLFEVLERWRQEIVNEELAEVGLPTSATRPFDVRSADVAEETGLQGAAVWSKVLPILLLVWAMTGAFYPAIDLCAGEKERGTLETLLSSPAERSEIVLGKLVTIMIFSMATATLNLVSMGVTGWLLLAQLPQFGPPSVTAVLWLSIALVPVSALFSALCLALAAFARSTKEGQYYLMPLLLVTMPLVILPMAPGVELNLGNSLIPVTGVVLLLRSMLEGNFWIDWPFALPVAAVTLACCLLSIRWAVEQFNSESVLFREGERLNVGLWLRHLLEDRRPTPTVAAAISCGVLILLLRFFLSLSMTMPEDFRGLAMLALVTQLAVIAAPALLMTVMLTTSPRQTLLLRRPAWATLPAAAALAIVLHPSVDALRVAVTSLYPISQQTQEALTGMFTGAPGFWQM